MTEDDTFELLKYRVEVNSYGVRQYFNLDGDLHREGGPAYIDGDHIEWWVNGVRHRDDGPAMIVGKSNYWYHQGELHREDGPAIEWGDGSKEWYQNGRRHRLDGPAVMLKSGQREFWINDEYLSRKKFYEVTNVFYRKFEKKVP